MYPGTLITNIGHLKKIGVHSCLGAGTLKKGLVRARRTGGNQHPIQFVIFDGLLNLCDPRF
jgi:hypothetical protein